MASAIFRKYHLLIPTLALSKSGLWVEVYNFLSACLQAPRFLFTFNTISVYGAFVKKKFIDHKNRIDSIYYKCYYNHCNK